MSETRYQRQVRVAREKERHAKIVKELQLPATEAFELALQSYKPKCAEAGLPSEWTDWDRIPENREDYELPMPNRARAKELCGDCPLLDLCVDYAKANAIQHGVWGGQRIERGRWLDSE